MYDLPSAHRRRPLCDRPQRRARAHDTDPDQLDPGPPLRLDERRGPRRGSTEREAQPVCSRRLSRLGACRCPTSLVSTGSRTPGASAGRPTGPTGSTGPRPRRAIFSIDTPPPTVSGSLHVGHVFSLHPHRHHRPLPAHAGPRGLLPDGLGRQRPPHRAPGAELLRRAVRPARCPTTPDVRAPAEQPDASTRCRARGRNFVELCDQLVVARRGGVRGAVAPPRPLRRLDADLHDDRHRARRRTSPAGVPAQPRPRRGLPSRRAHPLGRRLPHRGRPGRARGPRARRRLPRAARSTALDGVAGRDRDDAPRAARRVRRPRRPPRRRALPAAVRHRGRARPLFGVEVPVVAHRARRSREGLRASR